MNGSTGGRVVGSPRMMDPGASIVMGNTPIAGEFHGKFQSKFDDLEVPQFQKTKKPSSKLT